MLEDVRGGRRHLGFTSGDAEIVPGDSVSWLGDQGWAEATGRFGIVRQLMPCRGSVVLYAGEIISLRQHGLTAGDRVA